MKSPFHAHDKPKSNGTANGHGKVSEAGSRNAILTEAIPTEAIPPRDAIPTEAILTRTTGPKTEPEPVEVETEPVYLTFAGKEDKASGKPSQWRFVPLPPGTRVRERHYGLYVALISVFGTLVGLLVVAGLVFLLMSMGGGGDGGTDSLGGEPEAIETTPGATDTLPGGEVSTTPGATGTGSTSGATTGGTGSGATGGQTTAAGPAFLQPQFGTYTYKASGYVQDFGRRSYPAEFKATVRASGKYSGCWEMEQQPFSDQTQVTVFCPGKDGSLSDVGGTNSTSRPIASNVSTITCDVPSKLVVPGMQPGSVTSTPVCAVKNSNSMAGNSSSSGPTTFVGLEMATVGSEKVETYHVRQDRTMSGGQTGTTVDHTWISTRNGMIVRMQHTVNLQTSFIPFKDEMTANLGALTPA